MTANHKLINQIEKSVTINALPSEVWHSLTTPELMKKWMSDLNIEIITDWTVGGPIIIQGESYNMGFKNEGTVLQFKPQQILEYTHLSSLSRLGDRPESYTTVTFCLTPNEGQTVLDLVLNNFPTDAIYRHFDHYWSVTIQLLKQSVERGPAFNFGI